MNFTLQYHAQRFFFDRQRFFFDRQRVFSHSKHHYVETKSLPFLAIYCIEPSAAVYPSVMTVRKTVKLTTWPDPLVQERLEDMGFFFDTHHHSWIRHCDSTEVQSLNDWLKRHHLSHEVFPAQGRGELKKHPRLSEQLVLRNGGGPTACALCGATNIACRQWVEGDDTDSTDYPNAAKFFLCGKCVQTRMQPHPRLYSPADEQL